jgi:hypothetical protein
VFMREEEKLARDVYVYLDSLWGECPDIHQHRKSEATHMASILTLLQRYALPTRPRRPGWGSSTRGCRCYTTSWWRAVRCRWSRP